MLSESTGIKPQSRSQSALRLGTNTIEGAKELKCCDEAFHIFSTWDFWENANRQHKVNCLNKKMKIGK